MSSAMQKENTVGSKIVPSLAALLFGVMFTLGGLVAGVLPLAQHLHGLWRTQNLVAVQADVVALELKTHVGEATTYQVHAEFGYDFNGARYRSTRIGAADNGSDNIDDYQEQKFQQLQTAKTQGRKVPLWVDPQQPDYAVFDPHVRWSKVLFSLPFAILFPAVGLGAFWYLWAVWRTPGAVNLLQSTRLIPASTVIKADSSGTLLSFLFAGIWNLMAWPFAILFLNNGSIAEHPVILLVALFPAVGLVLIFVCAKAWLARRRIGNPELHLASLPYIGMENFAAQIRFEPPLGEQSLWPQPLYSLQLECRCTHVDASRDSIALKILWAETKHYPQLPHGTTVIDMVLDLRGNLPPSGKLPEKDNEIVWHIILKVFGGEVKFVLPVSAG
jgi:Protein of unknown function (DUF3592)